MRTALALPIHPTRRHPRTGLALRAIGLHPKTGHPVWPIIGASEDDWSSVFEGKTPTEVKQALDDALAASTATGGDNPWAELFADQKPEDVKEALENSRKWETRAKGNVTKAQAYDELVKKITGKDEEPDPEKLTQELTAAQRDARATKVENAVLKQAGKHNANPALLADSRSFMDSIDDLDPADADFASKIDAAIKKAVDANEALKVTPAAGPRPVRQQGTPSQGKQGGVQAGAERYRERRQHSSSTTTS